MDKLTIEELLAIVHHGRLDYADGIIQFCDACEELRARGFIPQTTEAEHG